MKKWSHYDVLKSKKINYGELTKEVQFEVQVLGGLDIFTDAHVRGVTDITTKLCERMKMDYSTLKHMVVSAYLHDVGKIMIPSEILQKQGRLTDEEYEIIKTHTTHGYDICMNYKELKQYAPVARWHHESFDGTGYPDKLVGTQIPFEATVVKIADVYDALTRKRQYKEGFYKSQALEIMVRDAKAGKLSAKILFHLIEYVIGEMYEEVFVTTKNIEELKNQLSVLYDIENIYQEIYDKGSTTKLEKKLKRYELASGYDMSTNAHLISVKQKALEKEQQRLLFLKEEEKKLQSQYEETYLLAKNENWYPDEPYYK